MSTLTHGMSRSAEYRAWRRMKSYCGNPKSPFYGRYGGRGIRVCDAWLASFEAFFAHVGPRPSQQHSIDRIDNNGHYEPGNVRWATSFEQAANTSDNLRLTYQGVTLHLSEWARRIGIGRHSLLRRLQRGWSVEKAVSTPAIETGRRAAMADTR